MAAGFLFFAIHKLICRRYIYFSSSPYLWICWDKLSQGHVMVIMSIAALPQKWTSMLIKWARDRQGSGAVAWRIWKAIERINFIFTYRLKNSFSLWTYILNIQSTKEEYTLYLYISLSWSWYNDSIISTFCFQEWSLLLYYYNKSHKHVVSWFFCDDVWSYPLREGAQIVGKHMSILTTVHDIWSF